MRKYLKEILLGFLYNIFIGYGLCLFCFYILRLYTDVIALSVIFISLMITGYFFGWFWQKISLDFWQKAYLAFKSVVFNAVLFITIWSLLYSNQVNYFALIFSTFIISFFSFMILSPFILLGVWLYLKSTKYFVKQNSQ